MSSEVRGAGSPEPRAAGTFEVKNRLGLHARAAAKLSTIASSFSCDIVIGRDGQTANAKSVMGVLLLCGAKGTRLDVCATGKGADEAVKEIGRLIDGRFGEDE